MALPDLIFEEYSHFYVEVDCKKVRSKSETSQSVPDYYSNRSEKMQTSQCLAIKVFRIWEYHEIMSIAFGFADGSVCGVRKEIISVSIPQHYH